MNVEVLLISTVSINLFDEYGLPARFIFSLCIVDDAHAPHYFLVRRQIELPIFRQATVEFPISRYSSLLTSVINKS